MYGSNNTLDETITSRFSKERRGGINGEPGTVVAYARQKDSWYVVSGYRRGKTFYRKCYLMNDYFVTFEITYPRTERAVWDKIVSRISL